MKKAINNTTVEVTFAEEIEDLKALDFKIEGLEVTNAVVKQTDKKTAVLTTAAQKADTEYTVTVNGKAIGKFKGVSAVVPTKIDVTTSSLQGVIGKEVTLKAQVTVAEGQSKAGIPVTFNIVSDNTNINSKIEVEALTDENGVATYSYTRYYSHNDNVAAYATSKSSVVSNGKVYWADKTQLAVSELTTGNELANETKKSYKVTGKANTTYYIAIKENLNVTPDKITDVKVQNHGTQNFVTPYELTTGSDNFASVTTNSNGEGSFTVYGTNLSATPIVYLPSSVNASATDYSYSKLALQSEAPTVKFAQVDRLAIAVVGEGTADSAEYFGNVAPVAADANSAGGRTYTVTVTDKDGKVAPAGTVAHVKFEDMAGDVYFQTGNANFVKLAKNDIKPLTVGKDGKVQFRVAGKGATSYVKPTVFLNTTGSVTQVALDKADVQTVAEVTYFKTPIVTNASLEVTDINGREITSISANQDAYFTYQSVDQNGFAYRPGNYTVTPGSTTTIYVQETNPVTGVVTFVPKVVPIDPITANTYVLAFDVTSTFGQAVVKDANGVTLPAIQNIGSSKTYHVNSNAQGTAVVRITSQSVDTVSVNVSGASNILPTQTASVNFTSSTELPVVYTGDARINATNETITFNKADGTAYQAVSFANATFADASGTISKAAFVAKITDDAVAGKYSDVTSTRNADGKYHFVYRGVSANNLPAQPTPGNTGTIAFANTTFNATANQAVTVTDADLNISATVADTTTVAVSGSGASFNITLTETGVNTGVFTANITPAQLALFADGTITATYNDAKTAAGVAGVATATATLNTLTGVVTFATAPTTAYVAPSVTRAAVTSAAITATAVTPHSIDFIENGVTKTANITALSGTAAQNAAAIAAKITADTGLTATVNASNEVVVSASNDTNTITTGLVTDATAGFDNVTTTTAVSNAATPAVWTFNVATALAVGEKLTVALGSTTKTVTIAGAGDAAEIVALLNAAPAFSADYTVAATGSSVTITQKTAAPTTGKTLKVSVSK